jgi:tRNA(Ile)-lysidine synthetase-like protein
MNNILNTFYKDWFNNENYWFSKNNDIDKYLTITYDNLLDYEYNNLSINNKELYLIHFIIIYDQLPRHIFRNTDSNHIILYYLNKALDIIENNKYYYEKLIDIEWCFYMLPLRHTNDKNNILYVLKNAWIRYNKSNSNIIKKFIIATYDKSNFKEDILNNEVISYYYDKNILDNYSENDIITDITKFNNIGNFDIINTISNNSTIIISLSGGVDSMVCLINYKYRFPYINFVCVHINYKNRKESDDEARFIAFICYKYNIKLYIRDINEINRNICKLNDMREIYEEYTKKIRFNCYKSVTNNPIVILGHNKDDCFENILTNITYESKYNNLKGMDEYSIQDTNIIFIRPLLNVYKSDIYLFAKTNNIPYLKNSTPEWSQRGKIRNNIIPVLNNWDTRTINGFFKLSDIIEDLYLNLDININIFINNFIIYKNMINEKTQQICDYYKIIIKLSDLNLNKIFWKLVIYKLLNFNLSNKSLINLIDRLKIWIMKYEKHDINKITSIIINKYIIFNIYKNKNDNMITILIYNYKN